MINVEEGEGVRRACFLKKKGQRRIASELQMARKTVGKTISASCRFRTHLQRETWHPQDGAAQN